MKLCVSSYSFGSYMDQDKLGVLGIIDKAAQLGFSAIEFVDGGWADEFGIAEKTVRRARDAGIEIVAFCTGGDFLNSPSYSQEIDRVKKRLDFAAHLGVKMFRHDMSRGKEGVSYEDSVDLLALCAGEISQYGKHLGIVSLTENHGYFSQDASRLDMLFKRVNSDNFGILLDVGNFMCVDGDTVESVKLLSQYARHVHIKDFYLRKKEEVCAGGGWFATRGGNKLCGTAIGLGDAKVEQCISILKDRGYQGYYTVEYEGRDDNIEGICRGRDALAEYLK